MVTPNNATNRSQQASGAPASQSAIRPKGRQPQQQARQRMEALHPTLAPEIRRLHGPRTRRTARSVNRTHRVPTFRASFRVAARLAAHGQLGTISSVMPLSAKQKCRRGSSNVIIQSPLPHSWGRGHIMVKSGLAVSASVDGHRDLGQGLVASIQRDTGVKLK